MHSVSCDLYFYSEVRSLVLPRSMKKSSMNSECQSDSSDTFQDIQSIPRFKLNSIFFGSQTAFTHSLSVSIKCLAPKASCVATASSYPYCTHSFHLLMCPIQIPIPH